jgi:predicted secreted protein
VTLTAQAGEAELSLREAPTTGHRWRLTDLPSDVEILGTEFRAPQTGRLGASGERRFTLRARTPGTFRFTAVLVRGDEPPGDHVDVTLVAGDAPSV